MKNRKKVVNRESFSERATSMLMGYRVMAILAPQLGQISGVPVNSLPQFLQNIFPSFELILKLLRALLPILYCA
jgi:hypothetical protein